MSKLKKECELCSNTARMLCDSDQASLCWDCDEKVHAANFLVAKHSRTLLCHVCQSPTPWCAAGPNLGRTVSVCQACAHRPNHDGEIYSDGDDDDQEEERSEEEDEEEECSEDEDGENQVVPLTESNSTSSTDDDNVSSNSSSKRSATSDSSEDEDGSWCSQNQNSDENYRCSLELVRPLKMRRNGGNSAAETTAIVEKLQRFEGDASAMILNLCKFMGD